MNYLALATRLRTECGVSGSDTTVVGATGEWLRLCNWIAQSWVEIQEIYPNGWQWMDGTFSLPTVATDGEYTPSDAGLSDLAEWQRDTFRIYLAASGVGTQNRLPWMDYEAFRNTYLFGTNFTNYSFPSVFSIAPNENIVLGLAPDDIYTVTGRYFKTPTELTLDADIPNMPTRFHMLIVYQAMMNYGGFESAPEVFGEGERLYKKMLTSLKDDQAPVVKKARSLI